METEFFVGCLDRVGSERLTNAMQSLKGVSSVDVTLDSGRILVKYAPEHVTPFGVRQVALSLGFHPSDVPIECDETRRTPGLPGRTAHVFKQAAGVALFHTCNVLPRAKRVLGGFGMRTKKEWFRNRLARVQVGGGKTLHLASIGENYLSFQVFWKGAAFYEPITSMVLGELLRPGDTFIDVGANIGFFSLLLSAQTPGLQVIAFEPNPKNYALLVQNARSNGFRHFVCEPLALSDSAGVAQFYLADSDMSGSLRSDFAYHEAPPIEVKTVTLDSYLESRVMSERLTLKVDVEGAEDAFFLGARETIKTHKPDIIAEVAVASAPAYIPFLQEHGYRFYSINDEGLRPTTDLKPFVRGNLLFLNYLLSARPPELLAELFERIKPAIRKVDLTGTSKCVSHDHIYRALHGSLAR